jgi:hypothetical protein
MGKNFSGNNVGQKRRKNDSYPTPYGLTRLLATTGMFWTYYYNLSSDDCEYDHERVPTSILEPCCGERKAIVKVLQEPIWSGIKDFASFSNIEAYDLTEGKDYFDENRHFNYMITNPPFSRADDWIIHAKEIIDDSFALLLPLSYLHGIKRYRTIWQDKKFPLTDVYVFTRYPHLGGPWREDGKHTTAIQVYCWMIWKQGIFDNSDPRLHWLDNNHLVVNKKDSLTS